MKRCCLPRVQHVPSILLPRGDLKVAYRRIPHAVRGCGADVEKIAHHEKERAFRHSYLNTLPLKTRHSTELLFIGLVPHFRHGL